MAKKAKIWKSVHRHNKATGGNTCVEHFGERVIRNERVVTVAGVVETLAECTVKGNEVHVSLHIDGTASIIPTDAWDLVYSRYDALADLEAAVEASNEAHNRVVSEPKIAASIYLHFPDGSLIATADFADGSHADVEINTMDDLKAICDADTSVMSSSSLDFPHEETADRETWELCCEIRGNDFERLLEIVREDATRNFDKDPNFKVVKVTDNWTAVLRRVSANRLQRWEAFTLGQVDEDGHWAADDDPAATITVRQLNGTKVVVEYREIGSQHVTRTYAYNVSDGLKNNLQVVSSLS